MIVIATCFECLLYACLSALHVETEATEIKYLAYGFTANK